MEADIGALATRFRRFSEVESQGMSPFYSLLASRIAADPELLAIAAQTDPGQPPPNMLFGAVRFLLDRGEGRDLLALYPGASEPPTAGDPYPLFRSFALENRGAITKLLRSRTVQSNVVRRAAVLLLGLMRVAEMTRGRPIANVEVGCSLGLTLLWQQYEYDYGGGRRVGPQTSPVQIRTKLMGRHPTAPRQLPAVISNTGIELSPVRKDDADALAWLEALIWPEHQDNRDLWRAALPLLFASPPRVVEGDALDAVPDVVAEVASGIPVSIYHSHTLNQFTTDGRKELDELLCRLSETRPVFRLSFESEGPCSALRLFHYAGGHRTGNDHLANCEAHGRWIEWRSGR